MFEGSAARQLERYTHYQISSLSKPAIQFFDNVTDVGGGDEPIRIGGMDSGGANEYDPSLTGDYGIAGKVGGSLAFALTDAGGLIGGFNFDDGHQWIDDGVGSAGSFTGIQARTADTTKSFFTGADNKSGLNAKFYARADGDIFHAAIGSIVARKLTLADFGELSSTNNASDFDSTDQWYVEVTSSDGATGTKEFVAINGYFRRKFGEEKLTLYSRIIAEEQGVGSFDHEIEINVYEGTSLVASDITSYDGLGSGDPIEQDVDISGTSSLVPLRAEVILRIRTFPAAGETVTGKTGLTSETTLKSETG